MQEAGVSEKKLGPLSRQRHNAIEVSIARAANVDVLGNRKPDRDDPTGVLWDPEGPLIEMLIEMGFVDADDPEYTTHG